MKFWDTSALVPLFVTQPQSIVVRALLTEDPSFIVWWGARVELASAFARGRREGVISSDDLRTLRNQAQVLFEATITIMPDSALADRAERLLYTHSLRAADSLQLAAALRASQERPAGLGFVCFDLQLRQAAQLEGFSVLPASV